MKDEGKLSRESVVQIIWFWGFYHPKDVADESSLLTLIGPEAGILV